MPMPEPIDHRSQQTVVSCWSGGKDSCLALYELQRAGGIHIEALLTTVTRDFDRISMHGVRCSLLREQAASLGLPLQEISISRGADNQEYEASFGEALAAYHARGISQVVFGDLFLQDIRAYRDQLVARHNMTALYPVWGRNTRDLIEEFMSLGFKAVIVCVDPSQLDKGFVGRAIDEKLLGDLPDNVDPCGENGEFHTFVYDGPNFAKPVVFSTGEIVCRDGFWFCDLVPGG